MFKKLKDKLAEEVKSSPQRIQQFAQAAQAAVTSASSSISDITNSDLFSIGDNDSQSSRTAKPTTSNNQQSSFHEVTLSQSSAMGESESIDFLTGNDMMENQRQRRLSNSSFASDVSFRLPSYESPSMYHLQSDMEVSASEAEERGISSGAVSLDRVTKEQLYAAYRRTQDRYKKYRTQYADLARHYKLLERENAKARSVLVETQDKALRRISELREQCTLEQSAKAHLEKALRIEIEEKNLKIEALSTKVSLLQNMSHDTDGDGITLSSDKDNAKSESDVQLINISTDNDIKPTQTVESSSNESVLNSKIEKMEQLLNKYKESLKSIKEKNSQMTTELQMLSKELEVKVNENEQLKTNMSQITEAQRKIQELNIINEELQNKLNSYDFSKSKEISSLELDLQKAQEEITQLHSKINVFCKREEEYAISLAENKLSIHKELEGKEAEIKTLKDSLSTMKRELQSLTIINNDYKNSITNLEEERSKLNYEINELHATKFKLIELETQIQTLTQKCQSYEQSRTKYEEEQKCLQLQMNQETAEKLAMIDRNTYLENRISQLSDENSKKCDQIKHLENELQTFVEKKQETELQSNEVELWKSKYSKLECEIQEEREELIKLQTEIEKLLTNHESLQNENLKLHSMLSELNSENKSLRQKTDIIKNMSQLLLREIKNLQKDIKSVSEIMNPLKETVIDGIMTEIKAKLLEISTCSDMYNNINLKYNDLEIINTKLQNELENATLLHNNSVQDVINLKNEVKSLKKLISDYESNDALLQKEIISLTANHTHLNDEVILLRNEKEKLIIKLKEAEKMCNCLQKSLDHDKSQYLIALDKIKLLEDDKQTLQKRLNNLEKENELIDIEVEKLKLLHKDNITRIDVINKEKQVISENVAEKESYIQNLEEKLQILNHENISLKNQCESIASSVKTLELELDELRKLHNEIEAEKNRLNSIIEVLENKEREQTALIAENTKNTQTESENNNDDITSKEVILVEQSNNKEPKNNDDILSLLTNVEVLSAKNLEYEDEIKSLKENIILLSQQLLELNSNLKNNNSNAPEENLTEKYQTISKNYGLLKDDNKRLQSDIEGLQTYLTKISKENGILNDKLRESIAMSESSFGKGDSHIEHNEFELLKIEVITNKEKNEDLIRENSLLVEENLELKDQLRSQNYVEPKKCFKNEDKDFVSIDKYNNLLMSKNKLEEKFMSIEQINKSADGNMQQLQNNNEKLRLTNEKLERRLDEALVSLRHLHSLQENTELEYLRNILYEYLTGTGTHSITLAKVLAAVVKFDDKQTQNVLQKEKERQGLLRQLGLL